VDAPVEIKRSFCCDHPNVLRGYESKKEATLMTEM